MKYNKREIMMNAWNLVKNHGIDLRTAMKSAWALAKAMNAAENEGKKSGWNFRVDANDWAKYGKDRTYVSTRIYTNAWNLKNEIKLGYIDNMTGTFVAA